MVMTRHTLLYVFGSRGGARDVLWGERLRGFGKGRGHGSRRARRTGRRALDAAVRGAHEEAHITVQRESAQRVAALTCRLPSKPAWDAVVAVCVGRSWSGCASPSEELSPSWFPVSDLALHRMWDDEQYWLPQVLGGASLVADFTFDEACSTVRRHSSVEGSPE